MAASTIFALSSGGLPAAIAVVRISGPAAGFALTELAGPLPPARRAVRRRLVDPRDGAPLDDALVLWMPGPATATGEDIAELHVHGSRAVVAAVLDRLGELPGLRAAQAGEFTRQALDNQRMDLASVEGLGDLLRAETESQRRAALAMAEGGLARHVARWEEALLRISGQVEAMIEFDEEGDVTVDLTAVTDAVERLSSSIGAALAAPPAERLHDGIRVVIAGPPNAGKSTLLNALAGREAAITSDIAGTTRDIVEVPMRIGGIAFVLTDTAGLRPTSDPVEAVGVARAEQRIADADIILWLGDPSAAPPEANVLRLSAMSDIAYPVPGSDIAVSAVSGDGLPQLLIRLGQMAERLLPSDGGLALNARQRGECAAARTALDQASQATDILLLADDLRHARAALDRLTGKAGLENVLDRLFSAFCIGK